MKHKAHILHEKALVKKLRHDPGSAVVTKALGLTLTVEPAHTVQ